MILLVFYIYNEKIKMENKKLLWNREIYIYRKQLYFVFTLSYMARTSQTAKTLKNGRI